MLLSTEKFILISIKFFLPIGVLPIGAFSFSKILVKLNLPLLQWQG